MSLLDEFYAECDRVAEEAKNKPDAPLVDCVEPERNVERTMRIFHQLADTDNEASAQELFKRRQLAHMAAHGMSSMPTHVNIRAVRGGAFVQVYYAYAYINMPFNSIRIARKYVKYLGLPIKRGDV